MKVCWFGPQKYPWISARRTWPLWWSETGEAARGPVLALVPVYKYTSTSSQPQRMPQQFTFHLAKSLLKMSALKQAKNVVRFHWQNMDLTEGFLPHYAQIFKVSLVFILTSVQKSNWMGSHYIIAWSMMIFVISFSRNLTRVPKSFWLGICRSFVLVSSIAHVQHRRKLTSPL